MLIGKQPGEQFGASLAVSDFNGDQRDDIVVGAPHHTNYNSSELKYEVGAVYIYYQSEDSNYQGEPDIILRGESTGGRFGLAVAGLGDIDGDGYNDLAVGAPYERLDETKQEGSGTVYIYQGSLDGLRDRASQIISGQEFKPAIRTFGFAITAFDFDSNGYNDVIVGAYNSSYVTYLPSRPIAKVGSILQFLSESIRLSNKTCTYRNLSVGQDEILVACDEIQFCISYSGKGVTEMNITVNLVLDVNTDKRNRRVLFWENQSDELSKILVLKADSQQCRNLKFIVTPVITDDASVIQAKMNIKPSGQKDGTTVLIPIIPDKLTNIISRNSVSIFTSVTSSWWEYLAGAVGAIVILAAVVFILHKVNLV